MPFSTFFIKYKSFPIGEIYALSYLGTLMLPSLFNLNGLIDEVKQLIDNTKPKELEQEQVQE